MFNKTIFSRFIITAVLITVMVMISYSQTWHSLGGPPVAKDVHDVSAGHKNGTFIICAADAIKLSKTTDQGTNWSSIDTMKAPLLVACSPTNSDTVLVAKGTEVFLSIDGGSNFISTPRIQDVAPLRLLYSRGASKDAWVGTKYKKDANESSLKRSTNGGLEFEQIPYFDGSSGNRPKTNVEDVWTVPQKDSIVWVAGSMPPPSVGTGRIRGLWRSTNRGNSWPDTNFTISINPQTGAVKKFAKDLTAVTTTPSGNDIFVGTNDGIIARYISPAEFSQVKNLKGKINRLRATNDKLFVATEEGLFVGEISNLLATFNKKDAVEGRVLSLEIDPTNENTIIVGTEEYVYISTDGGASWPNKNPKTTIATLNSKAVIRIDNVILTISQKGKYDIIYRKVDTTWQTIDMAFAKYKFKGKDFYKHNGDTVFVFGRIDDTKDSALIAVSYNNGVSWNRLMINAGRSGAIINGMIKWKDTLFAYGEIGGSGSTTVNMVKSSNNFTTWTPVKSIGQHEVYSMVVKDNNTAYAGTEKGLFVTQNGGGSWDHRPSATRVGETGTPGKAFSIIRKENDIFLASEKGLFRYNTTSLQKNILRTKKYKQLLAHPDQDAVMYALVERSGSTKPDTILKSIDRGDTWLAEPVITTAYDIRRVIIDNGVLFAATDRGLYSFQLNAHVASVNLPPPAPTSPSDIVWESETSVLISGTPTIPEGSCLTIEPGVKVMFAPGSQLRIQGELSVQGTLDKKVLFVSESPSQRWGGIYIGNEAKANIDYAEISGATFGIFVSKSNAEISNTKIQNSLVGIGFYGMSYEPPVVDSCRIENNAWGLVALAGSKAIIKNSNITGGQKGVLVDASSPEFYRNTISNNTQVGVVIYGMGYPRFGGIAANQPGSNTIQNNTITQILAVKGYAFLGYGSGSSMLGGANIITSTDIYTPLAVALDNSVISAMGTYWGPQQTNQTNFLLDGSSQMIYEPVMDPEVIEQLLMDALQYRASGLYQNAIANYQQIISGDGTIIQALVELRETFTDMLAAGVDQTNQWLSYLQTLQTHYNPPMARTATKMLAHEYAKADMLKEALEKYLYALTLALDTETRISVLFSKMMLEGFDLDAEGDAEETYLSMKQQFPNDERTQLAQFELELINGVYSSVEFGKVSEFKVAMRELPNFPKADQKLNSIPKEFRIEQNYPNPFNPSTLIKYQLPQANKVEIKIYNIFGQEVKKLVDEVKDAGYYEIVWNSNNNTGKQVASGVYFYRLTAGSFSETKKLILMR